MVPLSPTYGPRSAPRPLLAPRPRPNRFKRKLKRLAIGTVITAGLLAGAAVECAMILKVIDVIAADERAHVERVASTRVAQECGRAR